LFQYVSSGLDSFLEAFNKTQEEITDAVTKLSSAQYDFQKAAEAFKNSTQKLDLNIFLEPEYLTGWKTALILERCQSEHYPVNSVF